VKALWLVLLLVSCASARTEPQALRLSFGDGLCSGTVVAPKVLLSAEHCLGDSPLTAVDGVETHATRVLRDGQDHVLIWTDRVIGHSHVHVGAPKQGDKVHWTGNPAGLPSVLREGYIAAIVDGDTLIDAPAFGGDSGSGIFNDRGELVGVLSGTYTWSNERGSFVLVYAKPLKFTPDDWKAAR
jgi:hypothetical protein